MFVYFFSTSPSSSLFLLLLQDLTYAVDLGVKRQLAYFLFFLGGGGEGGEGGGGEGAQCMCVCSVLMFQTENFKLNELICPLYK